MYTVRNFTNSTFSWTISLSLFGEAMHLPRELSISVQDFKSFRTATGFDKILPINIVIGKNNSGKSALIELVSSLITKTSLAAKGSKSLSETGVSVVPPKVHVKLQFGHKWIAEISNNEEMRNNLMSFGPDAIVEFDINADGAVSEVQASNCQPIPRAQARVAEIFRNSVGNPFTRYEFRHLQAERDISAEPADTKEITLQRDGTNCTRLIEHHLHEHNGSPHLIEKLLLRDLNSIMEPDCGFTRINTNRRGAHWQILLEDRKGKSIELSEMGSGLKTVLLVLLNTSVLPSLHPEKPLRNWVFAFEELENHLHPAILRRLLLHLCNFTITNKATLFITTHSSVAVDLLSNNKNAQIVHVTSDGEWSKVTSVGCRESGLAAIRDLGAKPSDILLTNGVVWVEGPSDRIYFNAWIKHFSKDRLREDAHYQVLFLGGSNASHFEFGIEKLSEDEMGGLIKALRLNHNAIVLLDRDRGSADEELKPHAERIRAEAEASGSLCWITDCREVENYIPHAALVAGLKREIPPITDPYSSLFDHVESNGGQASFREQKTDFARRIAAHFTIQNLSLVPGLKATMRTVCQRIADWNGVTLANDV
jgi:predicted ATP-dependent endonuclease of OLD family